MDANESRHRVKQLREIDERLEKIGKRLSRSTALIAQDAENMEFIRRPATPTRPLRPR